jgi:hypothetical protein
MQAMAIVMIGRVGKLIWVSSISLSSDSRPPPMTVHQYSGKKQ